MGDEISFYCSILGHDVGNVFLVDILRGRTVGHLKDAIKEKAPGLDQIVADEPDIWKASERTPTQRPWMTSGSVFAALYSLFRRYHW